MFNVNMCIIKPIFIIENMCHGIVDPKQFSCQLEVVAILRGCLKVVKSLLFPAPQVTYVTKGTVISTDWKLIMITSVWEEINCL